MKKEKEQSTRKNYDRKHPEYDYPRIIGDEIVFLNSDGSLRKEDVREKIKPLVLEKVTEEEYSWLKENAVDPQYTLIRNPQTSQIGIKWGGHLYLDPLEIVSVRSYHELTFAVQRLQFALDQHRKGKETGWGDAMVYDGLIRK